MTFYIKPYDQQWRDRIEIRIRRALNRAGESVIRHGGKPQDLATAYGRVIAHARSIGWVI